MPNCLGFLQGFGIKLRMQKRIKLFRLYAENGFFLVDHTLVHHVDGDLQGSVCRAFSVAGLQHEKLAVFNGEFHVLHIPVMLFQCVGNLCELLVHVGHIGFQLIDRLRRADAGHDIFALCVDQVFTEQFLLSGCRVAGKGHACAGLVAGVAEYHFLHVDCSAPRIGDLVHAAVNFCTGVVP